jgi:hypothetical protein
MPKVLRWRRKQASMTAHLLFSCTLHCTPQSSSLLNHDEHYLTRKPAHDHIPPLSAELLNAIQLAYTPQTHTLPEKNYIYIAATPTQPPRQLLQPALTAARRICHVAMCAPALAGRATQALPRFGRRAACGASCYHAFLLAVQLLPITYAEDLPVLAFSWEDTDRADCAFDL